MATSAISARSTYTTGWPWLSTKTAPANRSTTAAATSSGIGASTGWRLLVCRSLVIVFTSRVVGHLGRLLTSRVRRS